MTYEEAAHRLNGEVLHDAEGPYILAPAPGHSAKDRSLSVRFRPRAPRGVLINIFSPKDKGNELAIKDKVCDTLGLPPFEPGKDHKRSNGPSPTQTGTDQVDADQAERTRAANARLKLAMAKDDDAKAAARKPIATFDYSNADGTLRYQKLKYSGVPKYGQRQPDGGGGWIPNLDGVNRVLYRLPDLMKYQSATVFACEGEKDADRVAGLGLCATSADAGTWKPDLVEPLRGRDTIVLADFDPAGVRRALEAANALHGVAASIRMVFLPGLTGEKGNKDVSDWLDADPARADTLVNVCQAAPQWTPDTDVEGMAVAAKVRSATAQRSGETDGSGVADHNDDDRPSVQIAAGEIALMATRAEEMLIAAGAPLYQRAGVLVRPIIETVDASHGRTTQVAQLKILDSPYMRDLLCRHVNWLRYDGRKRDNVKTDPPLSVVVTILARTGDWKVPAIAGIISTPTMRPDGSLLTEPGFDSATRLLLVAPPTIPPIPERPTRDDALAALAQLEGLLSEFPFVDDVAEAVALSAIITPVVRGAFPVTPMHVARAPTSGSGKSYLWDIVAVREFRDVLRGEFGLNMSDQQIDECVAVMKAKGTGDAPHPFFA
jgi:hypothetical protein